MAWRVSSPDCGAMSSATPAPTAMPIANPAAKIAARLPPPDEPRTGARSGGDPGAGLDGPAGGTADERPLGEGPAYDIGQDSRRSVVRNLLTVASICTIIVSPGSRSRQPTSPCRPFCSGL
jgi:hypothetical protein